MKEGEEYLSIGDARKLGRILEAYELGTVFGTVDRFGKPLSDSVICPGYYRVGNLVLEQRLVI